MVYLSCLHGQSFTTEHLHSTFWEPGLVLIWHNSTQHTITEIITQADERIIQLVQTGFSLFIHLVGAGGGGGPLDVDGPNQKKKTNKQTPVHTHLKHGTLSLHGQK